MSRAVTDKSTTSQVRVASLLRRVGRIAIWIFLALLLARGFGSVLSGAPRSGPGFAAQRGASDDPASAALAIRFARAYLSDPSSRASASLVAGGVRLGAGRPAPGGIGVAQAEVSAVLPLGGGETVLTVSNELRDGRVLDLAVPISRTDAGEAAVSGQPWIVAAPSAVGTAERPRPLAGPGAAAIRALAERFLPAYLAARSPHDLSYMLAPGAAVSPLGGALAPIGTAGSVSQLGSGEGGSRTILVSGRFRDPASGAVYPLAYRLRVIRHGRWYVRSVEGGLS